MFSAGYSQTQSFQPFSVLTWYMNHFTQKFRICGLGKWNQDGKELITDTLEVTAHTICEQNGNDSHHISDLASQDHF
jgi:hypothetical protein